MAVSRYRDRYSVARKKSDAGDAFVLANILRTDLATHRPLPADSELAQAIAVLARAQQDAVWERTCAHNKLRSLLREYYPALLEAFTDKRGGLLRPEARALLAAAPTPRAAAKLTIPQLAALLRRAGRQRGVDAEAARIQAILRTEYLHQLPLVEDAFGRQALALLRALDTATVGYVWAFSALTASPGARTHYDRRKTTGDRHTAAQTQPVQPTPGLFVPLPANPTALQRTDRLPHHPPTQPTLQLDKLTAWDVSSADVVGRPGPAAS